MRLGKVTCLDISVANAVDEITQSSHTESSRKTARKSR